MLFTHQINTQIQKKLSNHLKRHLLRISLPVASVLLLVGAFLIHSPVLAAECPVLTSAPPPGYCTGQVHSVSPGSPLPITNPGDVVVFEDGVYDTDPDNDGTIYRITRSGTATKWVTYVARNKWQAVIDGTNLPPKNENNGIVLTSASFVRVEGFEVKNLANKGIPRGSASGIDLYKGGHVSQIIGNYIHHIGNTCTTPTNTNGQVGIYIQSGKTFAPGPGGKGSITVERNLIHDIGRYHVGENGCGNTTYALDHGMYINGSSGGGGGAGNVTVKNNIFYNTRHGWGVQVYPGTVPNVNILNNTFAHCNQNKNYTCIVMNGTIQNSKVVNNIFYNPEAATNVSKTLALYGINSASTISVANNLTTGSYMHDHNRLPSGIVLTANLLNTDPLIISSPLDFHLQPASPAINSGQSLPQVETDFDGTARPQGTGYDIGAYEFLQQ